MALKNIQLANISAIDRKAGVFEVGAYDDTGSMMAFFRCSSEADGLALRNAIRDHADSLRRVADYRDTGSPSESETLRSLLREMWKRTDCSEWDAGFVEEVRQAIA